jgi:phospholipid-binding lipoprotein MlaA
MMRPCKIILLSALATLMLAAGAANAVPFAADDAGPRATEQQTAANTQQAGPPAAQPSDVAETKSSATDPTEDANDPLEGMNRAIFHSSMFVDHNLFRPIALGYRYVVPHPVRNAVRNALNNLDSPPIFANEVLQGEFRDAGTTVLRFGINSTVGVAGLFEVADGWGFPRHTDDFGLTLGKYGVGEGPYLFLPFIGPAPPRDLTGHVVDYFFDPLTYVHMGSQNYWRYVRTGVDAVDLRERNIEALDEIERTSVDYYASIRSLYRQTRNNEINNGKTDVENLPNF